MNGSWRAVGEDGHPIHGDTVHDKLHPNFTSVADPSLLNMPPPIAESPHPNLLAFRSGFRFQPCGNGGFDLDSPGNRKLCIRIAAGVLIHAELQEMAASITTVK